MMNKPLLSENWDKSGVREWLSYRFWTPQAFADNNGISIRQLRNHMTINGMPHHGHPHRGVPGSGIRLGESARKWLVAYRQATCNGRFKFSRGTVMNDDIACQHDDDKQAYARLYSQPIPHDEYLADPENVEERRSWKTKFKEVKRGNSAKA